MTKDVLVTGATGFIGRRLAEVLVASGNNVRLLVRERSRLSDALRDSCQIIVGALENENALVEATRQVATVYHCAANVRTWGAWESYYETNVLGLENLLRAIHKANTILPRLVHLSTVDVYGFPAEPCDETAPLDDAGFHYGRSKILAEELIQKDSRQSGLPYTILRPCNVIGPRSPLIARVGRGLKAGLMMTVDGGSCNAGIIYIDNLVRIIMKSADTSLTLNEVYNVRDNYDVSWKQFIKVLRKAIDGRGIVFNFPFPVANGMAVVLSSLHRRLNIGREPLLHPLFVHIFGRTCGHSARKIMEVCGPETTISFEDSMKKTCDWLVEDLQR